MSLSDESAGEIALAITSGPRHQFEVITAVLWDNDGVLVDSEAMFFEVTRQAFARAGATLSAEHWARSYLGVGQHSREVGLGLGISESDIDSLLDRRNATFRERLRHPVPTLPGVPETVRALQGRVRQAIVTGASREHVNLTHRHTGLLPFFETIVTSADYECAKPHPDAYLAALRRMGIAADEALAIEDSPRGANAALAAGVRCLVIPTPLTRLTEFPSGAQIETDVRQLVDWLDAHANENP